MPNSPSVTFLPLRHSPLLASLTQSVPKEMFSKRSSRVWAVTQPHSILSQLTLKLCLRKPQWIVNLPLSHPESMADRYQANAEHRCEVAVLTNKLNGVKPHWKFTWFNKAYFLLNISFVLFHMRGHFYSYLWFLKCGKGWTLLTLFCDYNIS